MESREKDIYRGFELFFDGCYMVKPDVTKCDTYTMGVSLIQYNEENDTLTVFLRRPGLIVGKGGETIDKLKAYLGCEVNIKEQKYLYQKLEE